MSGDEKDEIYLGVYKNILRHRGENNSLDDIKMLINSKDHEPRYWSMFMIGGGHFAGLVLDVARNSKVTNPKEVKAIVHKTFHRYTSKRKL